MPKPVMTTRCIGQATHYSGHPLAPMEYVYVCEEPVRPSFLSRLTSFTLRVITVIMVIGGIRAIASLLG
jgi:hypothetical protein